MEDEVLLRVLRGTNDLDNDDVRHDELSDADSVDTPEPIQQLDPDMQRLQEDMALRQHLGVGKAFTGPKGVIAGLSLLTNNR
jgi:hypothetical protein